MAVDGVHYLALSSARQRYAETTEELDKARVQLDEALQLGDLSENSEYDAAKALVGKLSRQLDDLSSVMAMQSVRSDDHLSIIDEGSIIELTVWKVTRNPVKVGSSEFEELKKGQPPFKGVLMYGASLSIHELLNDRMLSVDTPVGQAIYRKQSGDFSVAVKVGFANISVQKLKTADISSADLYCDVGHTHYGQENPA